MSAAYAILAARGVSSIRVPAPTDLEQQLVAQAQRTLPPAYRNRVKAVDQNGKVLKLVREYLAPIRFEGKHFTGNAHEDFPWLAEGYLYELALASKLGIGVAGRDLDALRAVLVQVDPTRYSPAGRIRFGEIVALINSYAPAEGIVGVAKGLPGSPAATMWRAIEEASFDAVAAENALIATALHPIIAARRAKECLSEFLKTPTLRNTMYVAEAATAVVLPEAPRAALGALRHVAEDPNAELFAPPILDLGAALPTAARLSIRDAFPGARAASHLAIQQFRGEWVTHAWADAEDEPITERIARPYLHAASWLRNETRREEVRAACHELQKNLLG